ncbi:MAG: CBS domain-containing protein [Pseudomonadales bacterium]|jgi:CBS domain-containing protein
MLRSLKLKDHMVTNPVTVSAKDSVLHAIDNIITNKVSGVCVVDGDNNLVGIVSELDCLNAILNATYNGASSEVGSVESIMTKEVVTASPDDDIVVTASAMMKVRHRRRPVVLAGKLVGQVTVRQLLSAVKEFSVAG